MRYGALAALMLAGMAAPIAVCAPPEVYRLLYPPARSVQKNLFDVIVAAPRGSPPPKVMLGTGQVRLTRLRFSESWVSPGLLTATSDRIGDRERAELWIGAARASPGAQRLRLGDQTVALHVGPKPPKGWPVASVHPPVAAPKGELRCAGCHAMGPGVLGAAPPDRSCGKCHDEIAVQTIHKHVAPPLARCAMCHDPHGALRPKLLTDAREKLCTRCHAGGHSKG